MAYRAALPQPLVEESPVIPARRAGILLHMHPASAHQPARARSAACWLALAAILLVGSATGMPALELAVIAGPVPRTDAAPTLKVLLFACHDCPISLSYMPEVQRIADHYAARGVALYVVLEDSAMTVDQARAWAASAIPRSPLVLDATHELARQLGPQVTPEAVIVGADQAVLYRGRIDNTWAALGHARAQASSHDLCDALDAVLAGMPIHQPVAKAIGCVIDLDDRVVR
jgi:hypothetical protein